MQRYRTKVTEVEASRLSVATAVDGVRGRVGDWLVLSNDQLSVMKAKDFVDRYELAGAAVEAPRRQGPRTSAKRGGGGDTVTADQVRTIGGFSARALPSEKLREECRGLFEQGMKVSEIAVKKGVKYMTIYNWKVNGEWEVT